MRALERAYAKAGIDPATVGYVEAHGTGTAVGDVVEIEALSRVFRSRGAGPGRCVVGSVKSQIGHTKCAAGLAGLINATLALRHRTLPPTIGITAPNPRLDLARGPFRLSVEAQPWLHADADHPRRAGVSAFGFGGTNFHAVLEAYERDPVATPFAPTRDWPVELLAWSAADRDGLLLDLDRLCERLAAGARPPLRDLAHTLAARLDTPVTGPTLAIVTTSHDDLIAKLNFAREAIRGGTSEVSDPRGIYFEERPAFSGQKVAFIFPGQGSQAVGMLRDLAIHFDEVRRAYEEFEAVIAAAGGEPIATRIFPPPAFDDEERRRQAEALRATEVAQPAIGAASVGLLRLLAELGVKPDMTAGHSYGELVALHAAGALDTRGLAVLSSSAWPALARRGRRSPWINGRPADRRQGCGGADRRSDRRPDRQRQRPEPDCRRRAAPGDREGSGTCRGAAGSGPALARGVRLPHAAHGARARAAGAACGGGAHRARSRAPSSRILMRRSIRPIPGPSPNGSASM